MTNEVEGTEAIFTLLSPFLDLNLDELRVAQSILEFKGENKAPTAKQISKAKNIQVGKVYVALKRLKEKSLVISVSLPGRRPERFEPITPNAMKRLVKIKILERASNYTQEYKKSYGTATPIFRSPRFEPLETRTKVYEKAIELVETHPEDIYVISRRGAFYKWVCTPDLKVIDPRDEISCELGGLLRQYLEVGGYIYAFISKQSPVEEVKKIEEMFNEKDEKHFRVRYLDEDYHGVTALMCNNSIILGWSKQSDHTEEGICFISKAITDFVRVIWSVAFEKPDVGAFLKILMDQGLIEKQDTMNRLTDLGEDWLRKQAG